MLTAQQKKTRLIKTSLTGVEKMKTVKKIKKIIETKQIEINKTIQVIEANNFFEKIVDGWMGEEKTGILPARYLNNQLSHFL
jgi:hypothetical protein